MQTFTDKDFWQILSRISHNSIVVCTSILYFYPSVQVDQNFDKSLIYYWGTGEPEQALH